MLVRVREIRSTFEGGGMRLLSFSQAGHHVAPLITVSRGAEMLKPIGLLKVPVFLCAKVK